MSPRRFSFFVLLVPALAGAFFLGRFSGRERVSARDADAGSGSAMAAAERPRDAAATGTAPKSVDATTGTLAAGARREAALAAAHRAPDRATRLYAFAQRLRDVPAGEFPALLHGLRRARNADTPELVAMLCSVWGAQDGPAAFKAARELTASDSEYGAWHAAIRAWAGVDPAAARAALQQAGKTDLATDEMAAWVEGWAHQAPAAAEAFLAASASGGGDGEADIPAAVQRGFEAIARARIEADMDSALAWYAQLREPLRERLRQAMTAKLSAVNPARASEWLARDESAQLGASDLVPVLRGLELSGFDAQFGWARSPANATTRESALAAVVRESAPSHLVALGEWLAVRADDASLTPAFSAYAMHVVRRSPTAAVTWALSLDQPAVRQATLNTVAAEWMTMNPQAAREWALRTKLVDWEALVR